MTYKTIHTRNGLVAVAQAEDTGAPINLTHPPAGLTASQRVYVNNAGAWVKIA